VDRSAHQAIHAYSDSCAEDHGAVQDHYTVQDHNTVQDDDTIQAPGTGHDPDGVARSKTPFTQPIGKSDTAERGRVMRD
jgi:hypothetical protein